MATVRYATYLYVRSADGKFIFVVKCVSYEVTHSLLKLLTLTLGTPGQHSRGIRREYTY